MAEFVRSIVSSLSLETQWLRHLEGVPTCEEHSGLAENRIPRARIKAFVDAVQRTVALVSSSLARSLDASSFRSNLERARLIFRARSLYPRLRSAFSDGSAVPDGKPFSLPGLPESGTDEGLQDLVRQFALFPKALYQGVPRTDSGARLRLQAWRIGELLDSEAAGLRDEPDPDEALQSHLARGLGLFRDALSDPSLYTESASAFRSALALEPGDCLALYHLGLLCLYTPHCFDLEEAGDLLTRAGVCAEAPDTSLSAYIAGLLVTDPATPSADYPAFPDAPCRLAADAFALAAQCCYLRGQNEDARELYTRSLILMPEDRQALVGNLRMYALRGWRLSFIEDLQPLIEADPGLSLQMALDMDFTDTRVCDFDTPSSALEDLLTTLRDEAAAQLTRVIEACEFILAPQSAAVGLVTTLRACLKKNTYLDIQEGLHLLTRWRAELNGSSLGLVPFLQKEYPALMADPSILQNGSGVPPRAPVSVPVATAGSGTTPFWALDTMYSLLARVKDDPNLIQLLSEIRTNILTGAVQEAAFYIGPSAELRTHGITFPTRSIKGGLSTLLHGVESWLDLRDEGGGQARELVAAMKSWERQLRRARQLGHSAPAADALSPTIPPSRESAQDLNPPAHTRIIPLDPAVWSLGDEGIVISPLVVLVEVQGGSFIMGSDSNRRQPKSKHPVTLSSFYLAKHPVTRAFYEAVMAESPFMVCVESHAGRLPADTISWFKAVEFCNRLSDLEGLPRVYTLVGFEQDYWNKIPPLTGVLIDPTSTGYRLPTEAEWEYAARGGRFSQGFTYAGSNDIHIVANTHFNIHNRNHVVGSKAPNELGLYDMSGSIMEWCEDWSGDYSLEPQTDPRGPRSGSYRVLRGGSNSGECTDCTVFDRDSTIPENSAGFRIARSIERSGLSAPGSKGSS